MFENTGEYTETGFYHRKVPVQKVVSQQLREIQSAPDCGTFNLFQSIVPILNLIH